jgi:hypothetical protein
MSSSFRGAKLSILLHALSLRQLRRGRRTEAARR